MNVLNKSMVIKVILTCGHTFLCMNIELQYMTTSLYHTVESTVDVQYLKINEKTGIFSLILGNIEKSNLCF